MIKSLGMRGDLGKVIGDASVLILGDAHELLP